MQSTTSKRISIIFGIVMIAAMGSSVILPLLTQNVGTQTNVQDSPTEVPVPTFPPPPDVSTISADQPYLHPSGLFAVEYPEGWVPGEGTNNGVQAQINFTNSTVQSVIETYVEVPEPAVTTVAELSARYTEAILTRGWRNYSTSNETARREDGDRLIIDFELTLNQQRFLARHVAWTDGQWIYVVRVVAPENARDLLLDLLGKVIPTLQPNKVFYGTPAIWNAYFDTQDKHIIRYPSEWTLEDSAPGLPASISAAEQTVLRIEAQDGQIADEAAAAAWVESVASSATVLGVKPVERDGSAGFSVAYTYRNLDGEPISGLAVLLDGPDDKLHIANLRFAADSVDLSDLGEDADSSMTALAEVMNTFTIMPDLAVSPTG